MNADWLAYDGPVMAKAMATLVAYVHGPPIQPDAIINLDGFTRVHHGEPAYMQRYRDWPGFPGPKQEETPSDGAARA